MGLTKSENFTEQQNRRAAIFKALAHPARIAIVEVLIRRQVCICNDIVEELPLSQSTVSQHLRELKEVGIIKGDIEGTSICYCINEKTWDQIRNEMSGLFESFVPKSKCC
jgi:ArsR family transcriptional regulator, arsenate/arsenite/antimonite-responsive transcriptional repressor